MDYSTIKITSKKYGETPCRFRWRKLHRKRYVEARWIFSPSKLHGKKYVETIWIFWPSKLHRKKYVETTWILRPSKLRRKKYVETTGIFWSAKLHQKTTWKWRGNSLKFDLQHIDVIPMWNQRRFNMECALGVHCVTMTFGLFKNNVTHIFWLCIFSV